MYSTLLALGILLQVAHAAVLYSVEPTTGSLAGGTMVTLRGSGFQRDGIVGSTDVFIGHMRCDIIDYYSDDTKLVCRTRMLHRRNQSSNDIYRVVVGMHSFSSTSFATCMDLQTECMFQYHNESTPFIRRSMPVAKAGGELRFGGLLRGYASDEFDIRIDGKQCQLRNEFVISDSDGNILDLSLQQRSRRQSGDSNEFDAGIGPTDIDERVITNDPSLDVLWETCELPEDIVAGWYNYSMHIRPNQTGFGYGYAQFLERSYLSQSKDIVQYPPMMSSDSAHTLLIVPTIQTISTPLSGVNGGQLIFISGSGFDPSNCSNNVVTLSGIPCAVEDCSKDSLTCRAGPYIENSVSGAISGLRRMIWNEDNLDFGEFDQWRNPDLVETNFGGMVGKNNMGTESYTSSMFTEALVGYYVAPITGNYSFWVSADSEAWFQIDRNDSGLEVVAYTTTATQSYFDEESQKSLDIELTQGQRYPIRTVHTSQSDSDHFQVAVEIKNSNVIGGDQYHRVNEMQSLSLTATRRNQVVRIQLNGVRGGILGIENQQDIIEVQLNWTSTQITAAITSAMRQVIDGCNSFRTSISGNVQTTQSLTIEITYLCPAQIYVVDDLIGPQVQEWPRPYIVPTGLVGVAPQVDTSTIVSPSEPVSGMFQIGQFGIFSSPIEYSISSTAETAAAIEMVLKSFPHIDDVSVTGSGYAQGNATFEIMFNTPQGTNFPEIEIQIGQMTGERVTAQVDTIQDGIEDARLYDPVPMYMTELQEELPTASIAVNDINAACESLSLGTSSCEFVYSRNATPSITSVVAATSTVVEGDVINISGSELRYNNGGVSVTFGGGSCIIEAHSDTTILCRLDHSTYGSYVPVVNVEYLGVATIDSNVTEIQYGYRVDSVSPLTSGIQGGSLVTFTGTGFHPSNYDMNGVTIGGQSCEVVEASFTAVVCIAPAWSNSTLPTLNFGDADDQYAVIEIELFNYSHSSSFVFQWDLTPSLVYLDPVEISSALTTPITMMGSNFETGIFGSFSDTGCTATMNFVSSSGHVRSCSQLVIEGNNVSCLLTRSEPLPPDEQPFVVPRLTLCTPEGQRFVAHPEPWIGTVDLGLRIDTVYPQFGSIAGGTQLIITGAGFSDESDTIIRSALTYNYEEATTIVNVTLPDRTVPCLIISSNFSTIECTTIMPTARVGTSTTVPDHVYVGGGHNGLITASVNDFEVPGCVDSDGTTSSIDENSYSEPSDWVYQLSEGSWCAEARRFCLSWSEVVGDASRIQISMNGSTSGYLAVGIADVPNSMGPADVAMCSVRSDGFMLLHDRFNVERGLSISDGPDDQNLTAVSAFEQESPPFTSCTFSRPVELFSTTDRSFSSGGANLIWAVGPDDSDSIVTSTSDSSTWHRYRGSVTLNMFRRVLRTNTDQALTVINQYNASVISSCSFSYADEATPTLFAVEPQSGFGSTTVTLHGNGFGSSPSVTIGSQPCLLNLSNDTTIVCTTPSMAAGRYYFKVLVPEKGIAVHENPSTDGYVSFVSLLRFELATPRISSLAGGLVMSIFGSGFSENVENNSVAIGGVPAHIIDAQWDRLVVVSPRLSSPVGQYDISIIVNTDEYPDYFFGQTEPVRFSFDDVSNSSIIDATFDLPSSYRITSQQCGIPSDCRVQYMGAFTPTITSVEPQSGTEGTIITVEGTALNSGPLTEVVIGTELCVVINISESTIQCSMGKTPAGEHIVYVTVQDRGTALNPNDISFFSELNIANMSPSYGSFAGGTEITITGHGFGGGSSTSRRRRQLDGAWAGWAIYDIEEDEDTVLELGTKIHFCGAECEVTSSSYGSVTCTTTSLETTESILAYNHLEPQVLEPDTFISSDIGRSTAQYAFDGDFSRSFQGSWVGIDLGPTSLALVTRFRFFPKHQEASLTEGGIFETMDEYGNWTVLATITSAHQGWNWITVSTAVQNPTRYIRYIGPVGARSTMTQFEFYGYQVHSQSLCNATVSITETLSHPSHGVMTTSHNVTYSQVTDALYEYTETQTPIVTDIEPRFGSVLGGERINITGENLATSVENATVLLNGVACEVLSASANEIICITGPRGPLSQIKKSSVIVTNHALGMGSAIVNSSLRYRYLDRWSQVNSWLNDQPPVDGDTVIVPEHQAILLDVQPPRLFVLIVEGTLVFDRKNLNLDASYILVQGGTFEVGTEREPFLNTATITLHGDRRKSVELPFIGAKVLAVADKGGFTTHGEGRGIDVPLSQKGILDIHGRPRQRTWTKCAEGTITAGTFTIRTAEPTDFESGELLVLTAPRQEVHVDQRIDPYTFTVVEAIAEDHESEVRHHVGEGGDFTLDMRCEVALLSRNVVIQGAGGPRADGSPTILPGDDEDTSEDQLFGVHTGAFHGGHYRIENTELRHCGQAGVLGRYCLHYHVNDENPPPHSYLYSNSIHHSFQRATTIHGTHHSVVRNNVAYHVMGHTYFVEDGDETFNTFDSNIGIFTRPSHMMLKSDMQPATFWTAIPTNFWRNNVAVESSSRGAWFELTNQGITLEFNNNTFHHNQDIGWRNYPNYSPPAPQYFYNNSYFRNGGNGLFYKKGGDNHHIYSKFAENGVDIFWKKYITHDESRLIPNVHDCIFWGGVGAPAIFAPQHEFWYVNGSTFIDYDSTGVLSGCAGCCSANSMRQGAYTYRFERLWWENSPMKTRWTCPYKQIFLDLDGSLTGYVGGTAMPFYKFNEWDGHCTRSNSSYSLGWGAGGMVCNENVRVRRLQINGHHPVDLDRIRVSFKKSERYIDIDGNVTDRFGGVDWDKYHQTGVLYEPQCDSGNGADDWIPADFSGCDVMAGLDWINYRVCNSDFSGWAVPIATHHDYFIDFDWHVDFQQLSMRWTEPFYLNEPYNLPLSSETVGDPESILLRFPYNDYRYKYRVNFAGDYRQDTELEWFDRDTNVSHLSRADNFGTGLILREDDSKRTTGCCGEWHLAINPWEGVDVYGNSSNATIRDPLRIDIQALQCGPNMCGLPGDIPEVWPDPLFWSAESTWAEIENIPVNTIDVVPTGLKPIEGESVEIPSATYVIMDEDVPVLDKLVVVGKLEFQGARTINVHRLLVWGILQVGSPQVPYPDNFELVLRGVRTSPTLVATDQHFLGNKNVAVFGQMKLYGPAPSIVWTTLATTAIAGSTLITLSESVDWTIGQQIVIAPTEYPEPVDIWAQNGDFDMNRYRAHEQEERTIVAINGAQILLNQPLSYRHFSGSINTPRGNVELRCHVGMLSRSVIVRGAVEDSPTDENDNWYQGYGGHIVVGEVNYGSASEIAALRARGEVLNTVQKLGSVVATGVEFRDMGKLASEHGAFVFRFFSRLSRSQYPENRIERCTFPTTWNHALSTERSYGIQFIDNVIHKTFKSGIEIDPKSRGSNITGNLLIGNQRSPDEYDPSCELDRSCWAHPFAAFMIWNKYFDAFSGNVAAGCEDAGFTLYPVDSCDIRRPRVTNNTAYGALVGFQLLDYRSAGCREVNGIIAWKNAHIGVVTVDQTANLMLRDTHVADNHIGISLNFVQQGIENFAAITDSSIIGSSEASTCAGSSECRAVTESDVRGLSCGSVFGSTWRRVGLLMPQYTNLKKTCESGGLDICRPPNMVSRMCSMPWETRFGNVDVQHANFNVSRTSFTHFRNSDCGGRSMALSLNPSQPDFVPTTYFSELSWANNDANARMQLGDTMNFQFIGEATACRTSCDAVNYLSIHDLDGTTNDLSRWWNNYAPSEPSTLHSSQNPTAVDPTKCETDPLTSSFVCRNYASSRLVLESNPPRFTKRRLGPVTLAKYGASVSDNRTYWSVGPFAQGCSCQKHFAQFTFDVEQGKQYDLHSAGVLEDRNRISFISNDPDECIVVRIFFSKPQPVSVIRSSTREQIQPLTDGSRPSLTNSDHFTGTNVLDPQERMLYLKLCGGVEKQFWLMYEAQIQVTAMLSMSYDEFFVNEEVGRERTELFVQNMADLLGIQYSQIRVVCVHRAGEPCTRENRRRQDFQNATDENGIVIQLEILPVTTTIENGAVTSLSDYDRQVYLSEIYYGFVDNRTDFVEDFASKGFPVTELLIAYDDLLASSTTTIITTNNETILTGMAEGDSDSAPVGAIAGAAVAAVIIVIIIIVLALRRKRRSDKDPATPGHNVAFEADADGSWPLSFAKGSVHKRSAVAETIMNDTIMTPEEYDAESQPSYFAKRSRAELVKDSLFIKKASTEDTAYFDVSSQPEENERSCAIQHTNPDWHEQRIGDRAGTLKRLAPISDEEYRGVAVDSPFIK